MKSRALLFIPLAWLLVSAPTPGSVGSCGADQLNDPADFSSYCQQREQLGCVRRFLRKEITAATRDQCRWDAIDACSRSAFPSDCRPTRREADACLNALSSFDTLSTQEQNIPECKQKALCMATPSEQTDAGIDKPTGLSQPTDAGVDNP
jgi:hypothetical protein